MTVKCHAVQVILKPAEATPLTALALAELAHRAGMPQGVLNIVVGDAKAIGVLTHLFLPTPVCLTLSLLAAWPA